MKVTILVLCLGTSLLHASEPRPTAGSIIASSGDAPLTAKLTKFDYKRHLRDAALEKDDGLRQLFRFTISESFVGAGATDHCHILRDLLRLWGDREFARTLAAESPRVRSAVISAIDYTWPYPGWKPAQYPATYHLAQHDTSYRR
jgi:hypothetical protein